MVHGKQQQHDYGWRRREDIVPGVRLVWIFHPADVRYTLGVGNHYVLFVQEVLTYSF